MVKRSNAALAVLPFLPLYFDSQLQLWRLLKVKVQCYHVLSLYCKHFIRIRMA